MVKETTAKVFEYIKLHDGEQYTADRIVKDLGIPSRPVSGIITSFVRKKLVERVESAIPVADGTVKVINYIRLSEEGKKYTIPEDEIIKD